MPSLRISGEFDRQEVPSCRSVYTTTSRELAMRLDSQRQAVLTATCRRAARRLRHSSSSCTPQTRDHEKMSDASTPLRVPNREMKARQCAKIREIGEGLCAAGYVTLDKQADALGLARSTAWTVLRADHKGSGLSAAVLQRMLAAPKLPDAVREKLLEYLAEKSAGLYGHCANQRRRFLTALSARCVQAE